MRKDVFFCTSTLRGDSLEISHRRSSFVGARFRECKSRLTFIAPLDRQAGELIHKRVYEWKQMPISIIFNGLRVSEARSQKVVVNDRRKSVSDAYRHSNLCWRLSQEIQFLSPERMTNRSSLHITVIFNFHSNISTRPRILRWLISFSGLVSSLQLLKSIYMDMYVQFHGWLR